MTVLTGKVADDWKKLLQHNAAELEVEIEALEILPDPLHGFVAADPTDAAQRQAHQCKAFTSRRWRPKHAQLRSRPPCLWSRSYVGRDGPAIGREAKGGASRR